MRFLRRRSPKAPATNSNLDQALVLHLSKSRIPGPRQLKYVGKFLSAREKIALTICLLIAAASFVFMGILFYRHNIERVASSGGHYTEGIVGNPQYINPLYSSLNDADADIDRLVFSRLFTRAENGAAIPDLVDKIDLSADNKIYTLHLKEAKWSSGEILTADDVIFTFNLIGDPAFKSPLREKFSGVTAAKVDDRTVSFSLAEAYRDFPRLLDFGIMPQNAWEAISAQTLPLADLNIKPIGSGPYRFKSLSKSKTGTVRTYTLERNPDYYGEAPFLDEITFRFFPSAEEMFAALNNGQLSGIAHLESDLADSVVAKNSLDYHSIALPELTALFFNLKSKNSIAEKTVRQALSLSLDRQSIVNESVGRWGVASQSLLPDFAPGNKAPFVFDLERANSLLDQAGWLKNGEWRMKDNKPLTVSLTAPETSKAITEAISRHWQALGVKTEVSLKSAEAIEKEVIANRQFDILLYSELVAGGDPYPLWRSSAAANLSGWSRTDVDTWLTEARLVREESEAAKRYEAFLAVAVDEVPGTPLFWRAYVYPQSKKVKGFSLSTIEDPSERLAPVKGWHLNTSQRFKKD